MRAEAPLTAAYAERMISPSAEGPFETWADVKDTLRPILADNVAAIFLPWSAANAQALSAGEETMSVVLDGLPYEQATQKYHARSLGVLRRKYAEFGDKAAVDAALADTGCLQFLR